MYVPNYTMGNCAIVYDSNTIRVYDSRPTYNSTISYTDYFFNSHYLSRSGTQTFNNYSNLPVCRDDISTNFFYRNDITEILIIFTIFVGFTWFLVSKLIKTLLKGGRIK